MSVLAEAIGKHGRGSAQPDSAEETAASQLGPLELLAELPENAARPLAKPPAFVGWTAEWQTLRARWRNARQGQAQYVLIAGEAGIGKTCAD